jgi:hypothetical protein
MRFANSLRKFIVAVILCLATLPLVRAQDSGDLDNYKWRIDGDWWYSHPSGYFGLNATNNYFDINKDFGFGSYSTFTGRLDWHFAHKHHFLLTGTPNSNSKTSTLSRTITFDGQTFDVGAQVTADLSSFNIAPGYQYDIIRRDHGYLGLEADLNFIQTTGKLSLATNAGNVSGSTSGSKTFWAPLPDVGASFRWYPLHESNRLSFSGSFRGMPFFGYGNFMTGRADVGVGLTQHLNVRAGYEMGSRLSIHGTADQIAVKLLHRGPTVGIEYSFGESPAKKVKNPNPPPSDWHVDWVPFYLWFSGLSGDVGAGGVEAPVSVGFSKVFDQLNIGYMSDLDVRRKRIGLFTDLIFISLSSDQKTTPIGPLPTYVGFTANAKELIVNPDLYVRLVDSDRGSIDATGGVRFWHLNNSLDLFPPNNGTTFTAGQTQGWVDPVFGARARYNANKGIFFNLRGDAGGFGVGSQLTYQIYAGLGKQFKTKYDVQLGYRYLFVDYKNGGFVYDVHMSGMQVGFNIKFK